jgi:hypothetical protein
MALNNRLHERFQKNNVEITKTGKKSGTKRGKLDSENNARTLESRSQSNRSDTKTSAFR